MRPRQMLGFTLIELVAVMLILGIVSLGVSSFIRDGAQIFVDSTERDQLLSDSRFVIERMNREIRKAVPNSVLVDGSCVQFTSIGWSTFYTDVPVIPEPAGNASVVELFDHAGNYYEFVNQRADNRNDFAIVYPTNTNHVYANNSPRRAQITGFSEPSGDNDNRTQDDSGHLATLILGAGANFETESPAARLYIANEQISYCVENSQILRRSTSLDANVASATGILMAENVANNGDLPFVYNNANQTRNAVVTLFLRFARNDEVVEFSHEIHVANVP